MSRNPIIYSFDTYCRTEDGFNSTVKKLNNDLIKTRIREDTDNDDDTITTTIRISPEITTARKKNDSISSWDGDRKHGENGTRRSSDASIVLTEDTDSFIVGDRVWVGGTKPGVIAFIGETQFGPGDWAGIVLDEPIGKNDGAVAGKRYFQCESNHGIFSRLTRLSRVQLDYTPVTPRSNGTPFTSTPNHITSSVTSVNSSLKTPTGSSMGSADIKLGDRVIVQSSQGSKPGMLRYYGRTEFGTGIWCGVELDDPLGKNDGSVDGVKYFECASKFGLFVPVEKVSRSPANNKKASCIVHPAGISRQGTQESFRSISTIGTTASSVKSNARVRLGVNSLGQRPGRQSAVRSTPPVAPKSPLQVRVVKVYYPDWESGYY